MDHEELATIPLIAHENMMTRMQAETDKVREDAQCTMERMQTETDNVRKHSSKIIKILVSAMLVMFIFLVGYISFDRYHDSKTESEEITVNGEDGNANYAGGDGDFHYGLRESEKDEGCQTE